MRLSYCTFASGLPGVGLLLLRAAIGISLVIHAFLWIAESQSLSDGMLAASVVACAIGISFLAGFLTRLAGILSAVAGAAIHFRHPAWDHSVAALLSFNVIIIATAISLLGPGAFSLDARFFGRRKVIIPRVANSWAAHSSNTHSPLNDRHLLGDRRSRS